MITWTKKNHLPRRAFLVTCIKFHDLNLNYLWIYELLFCKKPSGKRSPPETWFPQASTWSSDFQSWESGHPRSSCRWTWNPALTEQNNDDTGDRVKDNITSKSEQDQTDVDLCGKGWGLISALSTQHASAWSLSRDRGTLVGQSKPGHFTSLCRQVAWGGQAELGSCQN